MGFKVKKILSAVLVGSMAVTLIPSAVTAAPDASVDNSLFSNAVRLDYEKGLKDNGDGTYTLSLDTQTVLSKSDKSNDRLRFQDGYYEAPKDGYYAVQLWGGRGAAGQRKTNFPLWFWYKDGGNGGSAGYVEGLVYLKAGQKLAYTVGTNGATKERNDDGGGVSEGGGDGGEHGKWGWYAVGGGGGFSSAYVYEADEEVTYDHAGTNYIMVAGGGGGGGAGMLLQRYQAHGGAAGSYDTANAHLDADQNNGVAGTYYAGIDGQSNGSYDDYIGKGGTNVPGEVNSTWIGLFKTASANDWLGTYVSEKGGGLGGDSNFRGGGGGAGFAGGSGGIQAGLVAWECGGGGGGSSFVADTNNDKTIEKTIPADMRTNLYIPTLSEIDAAYPQRESGAVVITPVQTVEEQEETTTVNLASTTVSGTISQYFDIQSVTASDGENTITGTSTNNSFTMSGVNLQTKSIIPSTKYTINIVVKPKDGFRGGNNVPLLTAMAVNSANDGVHPTYSYTIGENADTDFANVPFRFTVNTVKNQIKAGESVNVSSMYIYDNDRANIGISDNYKFVKEISDYAVADLNGSPVTGSVSPAETTKYRVSFDVTPIDNGTAKVGRVNRVTTFSNLAPVEVLQPGEMYVDGTKVKYEKSLTYDSADTSYNLTLTTSTQGTNTDTVVMAKTDESGTYIVPEDGYYYIDARGGDGGIGQKTYAQAFGGDTAEADGGGIGSGIESKMLVWLNAGEEISYETGHNGNSQSEPAYTFTLNGNSGFLGIGGYASRKLSVGLPGGGGTGSIVTLGGDLILAAGGGGGGGGSVSNSRSILGGSLTTTEGSYSRKGGKGQSVLEGNIQKSDDYSIYDGMDGQFPGIGKEYDKVGYQYDKDKELDVFGYCDSSSILWRYEGINDTSYKDINGNTIDGEYDSNYGGYGGYAGAWYKNADLDNSSVITTSNSPYMWLQNTEAYTTKLLAPGVKITKVTGGLLAGMALTTDISKYFDIVSVTKDGNNYTGYTTSENGSNETTIKIADISNDTNTSTVTYKLTPKGGFLGGNDIDLLNYLADGNATGMKLSRSGGTLDTSDDIGAIDKLNDTDFVNVEIPETSMEGFSVSDKTILNGESVNTADLCTLPTVETDDWRADFVQFTKSFTDAEGNTVDTETVSPNKTTTYNAYSALEPKVEIPEKAIVISQAEAVKRNGTATVYLEYKVDGTLDNLILSNTENAKYHEEYTTTLTGSVISDDDTRKVILPETITVKMDGVDLTEGQDYTYDSTTGVIVINKGVIEGDISIEASATFPTYSITYEAYDVSGMSLVETWTESDLEYGAAIDHTKEDAYTAKANLVAPDGYEYYWNWPNGRLDTMPDKDIVVCGYYDKKSYNLTINYVYDNGETVKGTDESGTEYEYSASMKYPFGSPIYIQSPEVEGYRPDKAMISDTMPAHDVTYTVTYSPLVNPSDDVLLTVFYVYRDGQEAAPAFVKEMPKNSSENITFPEIIGYVPSLDLTTSAGSSHTFVTWDENTAYTVTYIAVPVTVNFNANGGSLAASQLTKVVGYNEPYGALPSPLKTGFTFDGWYTKVDGGEKVTSHTIVTNTEAHTLYAHWTAITNNVVFNANGGKFEDGDLIKTAAFTGTYGVDTYPELDTAIAERNGYTFTGWYTNLAGIGAKVEPGTTKMYYTSSRTLYAGWEHTNWAKVKFAVKTNLVDLGSVISRIFNYGISDKYTGDIEKAPNNSQYFAGWEDSKGVTDKAVLEYKGANTFSIENDTEHDDGYGNFDFTYNDSYYDTAEVEDNIYLSDAKAQHVVISDKNYIRFISLIGAEGYTASSKSWKDYTQTGFVITTPDENTNPTIEGGFKFNSLSKVWSEVLTRGTYVKAGDLGTAISFKGTGQAIIYTNYPIASGKEDMEISATPYIKKTDGTYIYGETRTVTLNELQNLDAGYQSLDN